MKFFDTDWSVVFRWLPVWDKLSFAARQHYLLAAPSHAQSVSADGYGADLSAGLASGLVEMVGSGRVKPTAASVPFRAVMAQLAKFPLFDQKPTAKFLEDYTRKHFTREESDRIQFAWNQPAWDSLAWPKAFLKSADAKVWERNFLTPFEMNGNTRPNWGWTPQPVVPPKKTWFPDAETVEAAKCLVGQAVETSRTIPLLSLPALLPERLRPVLETALKACLRYFLLYPALRPETLEAVIGVCPTLVYLASRPAAVPPAWAICDRLASPAFRMEDMIRVLMEAAAGDCRLNRTGYDRQFFKSVEDRFREDFVALPDWLVSRYDFASRLHIAGAWLIDLKFVQDTFQSRPKRLLLATPKGRKWLTQPPADRLHELLFAMTRDQPEGFDEDDESLSFGLEECQFAVKAPGDFDHRPWLESVWRQAAHPEVVGLNAFLDYHARVSNPLVNPVVPEPFRPHLAYRYGSSRSVLREENVEEYCRAILEQYFWARLVPLGCVETGVDAKGEVCFQLSPAGRYLFGLNPELAYGRPTAEAGLVVQPNFEIVFLAPNLNAEIDLAPFAERCGKNVGTLFRLTRRQIISAAARGIKAADVLGALAKHSQKPVPENVAEEIRTWFAGCRTLTLRRSMLIDAGDREVALRVRRLLGAECRALSETLLEWPKAQLDPKLRKKLAELGLFLESKTGKDTEL
ncbi:MAG: helicase-associated domain-containing protein [Verrucomicrobia bacterium]|nr:helicase-associated domain-containing protein [Verrucomicrobiota bacterium]